MTQPGYDPEVVFAYLDSIGTKRLDGFYDALNEIRLTDSHRESIERWRRRPLVPLGRLDQILMAYEVHLFELEMFAEEQFGRNGFVPNQQEAA